MSLLASRHRDVHSLLRPHRASQGLCLGVLFLAALSIAACSDGGGGVATPALTVVDTPRARTTSAPPAGDPGFTVEQAVRACQEKDEELLRGVVAGQVPPDELEALLATEADVRLSSRTLPNIEDGTATVDLVLEITREGEVDLVERTWTLEQGETGVWLLTEPPACF